MIYPSLRQLRYFDAVARLGYFGRAAEACAVSQPALSMQIQELEEILGLVLIERGRKGVTLTPEGAEIARRAALILAEVRDLVDHARHAGGLLVGSLRFGMIPTVAPYLLPLLLPVLRTEFPGLTLRVRETQTARLLEELADGKLDVALMALPFEAPGFDAIPLFEDRFVLAVPVGHRSDGRYRVEPALLQEERLLLLEEGHCFREQALSYCKLQPADALDTLGASSFATLVRMVANGLGVTLLPELAAATEVASGGVRLVEFEEPAPSRHLGLVFRKSTPRRADYEALADLVRQHGPKG